MTTCTDEYQAMIDDCEKRESRLSEWDAGFIDSVSKQLEQNKPLSQKQIEKLNQIWEMATKNG